MVPAWARGQGSAPLSSQALDAYIARVAKAWEPFVTPDGRVIDPLDSADSGDNYGVIMLADVMLKAAARDGATDLADAGERIIAKAATGPPASEPFSLLAIASILRDGQAGRFPPEAWTRLAPSIAALAARLRPPSNLGCLTTPTCYSNWRLAWAAGAAELLASGRPLLGMSAAKVEATIRYDLAAAGHHAGPPASPSPLPGARELSDPGAEPPSYHLFSCALLELIAEADPTALTPATERLREQAAHYALELMAPDGQLSFFGRSLDQSWVQAAGAMLGADQASQEPARAGPWRSFADRAFGYLIRAYPARSDGLVPIVPGLLVDWSPAIMDPYAALNQYEGLTLWFLSNALDHWPNTTAPRAPLPGDIPGTLVGDLASSGLVWGRSGSVWWALSGRSTANDPRSSQGLAAIKVQTATGWQDLLALRPLKSALSPAWRVNQTGHRASELVLTSVRGNGSHVTLTGRLAGRDTALRLNTTRSGVVVSLTVPAGANVSARVWPTSATRVTDWLSHTRPRQCIVTASGRGCPARLLWSSDPNTQVRIGLW